jgi:signal transduction histidine kinase
MRNWLLILFLLPLAAGQSDVSAAMGFEESLSLTGFTAGGGQLTEETGPCTEREPTIKADHILFSENGTELGCGYVYYDAVLRHGARDVTAMFDMDRRIDRPGLLLPPYFVQELIFTKDGGFESHQTYEPRTGSRAEETWEIPITPNSDSFRLYWYFADQGNSLVDSGQAFGPPTPATHESTLRNITLRYEGIPAQVHPSTSKDSILDQTIYSLKVKWAPPTNETGLPFLDIFVPNQYHFETAHHGGSPFELNEVESSKPGFRQFHLGTHITSNYPEGDYTFIFSYVARNQQDAYLGPIAVMAFVFPMAGILFSYREYRHAKHRIGDDPVVNSGMAWLWRATVAIIVFAIGWVLLSGRFVGMLYWPPNVEDVLYYSILISTGGFMFLYMFLWRRQTLMVNLDKEIRRRRQTQDTLEQSNRDLEMFAYVASHDMKQPLRMVKFYTRRLKEKYGDTLDADAREYIDFAADNAERMEALVQGLLEYSRVDSAQFLPDHVNMNSVMEAARANLQLLIEETGANIKFDDLGDLQGNYTQLSQLMQNLVENGIKYRSDATPEIHVTRTENTFQVIDNGRGIPVKDIGRIFKLFKQLDVERDGEGIGLALCRRIVEKHGGTIFAKANPSGGTIIEFTLK